MATEAAAVADLAEFERFYAQMLPVRRIGEAVVRRPGGDVTIVSALACVETSLAAAQELAEEGIEAEVLDLRSLRPLDSEAIAESAGRAGRPVVVEEAPPMGGSAAEVVAAAVELAWPVPARPVTMPDVPIPFGPVLEDAVIPSSRDVVDAVSSLVGEPARASYAP